MLGGNSELIKVWWSWEEAVAVVLGGKEILKESEKLYCEDSRLWKQMKANQCADLGRPSRYVNG